MIYDCFLFFNELDVLEVRLNELYKTVDKFILVEATKTFTNQDKPLWFEQHKDRFAQFVDKIEHIIIDEYPEFDSAWTFENYQRDVIIKTLKKHCNPDDVILISDLDEIPKAELVEKYKNTDGTKIFEQALFTFYFNYLNATEPVWNKGTRLLKFKDIGDKTLTDVRFAEGKQIKNAGWHFTYLGGLEMVKYKIKSFAHQEYNNEYYMNENRLKKLIFDGIDIFERGYKYKIVNLDNFFPEYVRKNQEKFEHLILKQSPVFHRIKNALTPSKRQDKRYIDTCEPINENPVMDFISPLAEKFLEIGQSKLKELIENKLSPLQYENINPLESEQLNDMPENNFDCAILDETISQALNPSEVLKNIKSKLNRNGYIIMTVPNFRHISVLNQVLFKKNLKYEENGILSAKNNKFFTRKSLFDLIHSCGYYVVTFKGLNSTNSMDYKIKNALMFGNLYDSKHEKFLVVIKH